MGFKMPSQWRDDFLFEFSARRRCCCFFIHSHFTTYRLPFSVFSVEYLYHCSMIALCTPFFSCTLTFWAHFSLCYSAHGGGWKWGVKDVSMDMDFDDESTSYRSFWIDFDCLNAVAAAIATICLECIYKGICGCFILFCSQQPAGWVVGFQFLGYFCSSVQH